MESDPRSESNGRAAASGRSGFDVREPVRGKGYRGVAMEGFVARWYAKTRGTTAQLEEAERQAERLTGDLPESAHVLEVAPGPGYLSVEMARSGRLRVTGLDISRTFVELARAYARTNAVDVEFRWGDVSAMPVESATVDRVVCQAAFKNFRWPVAALDEMYRVLRPGGTAIVQDMRHEATDRAIREEVATMDLGRLRAFLTRRTLAGLRRRAYSEAGFRGLATASRFGGCSLSSEGIGMEARLRKP